MNEKADKTDKAESPTRRHGPASGRRTAPPDRERHVDLAKKLEKKHPSERSSSPRAIRDGRDAHEARTKPATEDDKRSGGRYQSCPARRPARSRRSSRTRSGTSEGLADEKLLALAKHSATKESSTRRNGRGIAILEADPGPAPVAREILGHERRGDAWLKPAEARIRTPSRNALRGRAAARPRPCGTEAAFESSAIGSSTSERAADRHNGRRREHPGRGRRDRALDQTGVGQEPR